MPVLLTAPFYLCSTYGEWYIDELFAITRNADMRPETPLRNLLVHDFWGQSLWPTGGEWTHKSYRPLVSLSFRWQLLLQGGEPLRPGPLRCVNCLVHSCNVLLVQLLLRQLRLSGGWALLGAALFALHPAHLENLPYLVGRADSMATGFLLLGVLLRPRARGPCRSRPVAALPRVLCSALCAALAGLCKETGFTLPVILAWEGLLAGELLAPVADLLCFALLVGLRSWYVGGTDVGFSFVDAPVRYSESLQTRVLSYLQQHSYYGQLLVLPWNQSWDYSYDALPLVVTCGDVRVLAILAAYTLLVAVVAHAVATRSLAASLGVGLIVIPFVPCSNLFFLVGTTVAERLLYPSTVGWVVLLAGLGSQYQRRHGDREGAWPQSRGRTRSTSLWRRALFSSACALAACYAFRASVRLWQWRSRVALYQADMRVWHRSAKVTHQYASLLHGGGQLEEALVHYQKSLDMFDDNALTDWCIAHIQMDLGRLTEANARFEKIIRGHGIGFGKHNYYLINLDYGWLLSRLGRHADAKPILEEGLRARPDAPYAWNALGIAQAQGGQPQEAMSSFLKAIELRPHNALIWSNAAVVAARAGARDQAANAIRNAAALAPEDATVAWNSGALLEGRAGELVLGYFLDALA